MYTPYQPGMSGPGPSSSSSSFAQSSTPGGVPRKRSTSPTKPPVLPTLPGLNASGTPTATAGTGINGDDAQPLKYQRAEELYNQRAEEEVARRLNAGRAYFATGARDQLGKRSDLFGRTFMRDRVNRLTKDTNMTFDPDTLAFIEQATEQRMRGLITAAVRAQIHRTQTSHHRLPPMTPRPAGSAGADGDDEDNKPMWSHVVTSDVNAVMDALTRQSKEAELAFRASRMDRIAREAEMARLREIREARAREAAGVSGEADVSGYTSGGAGAGGSGDVDMAGSAAAGEQDNAGGAGAGGGGGSGSGGPSTPRDKSSPSGPAAGATPMSSTSTPVFGAVRPSGTGTGKKSSGKAKSKEQSAESAHKMANLAARTAAGTNLGKYAWLSNTPNISSPLSGKRKKGVKRPAEGEAEGGAADGKGVKGEGGDQNGDGGAAAGIDANAETGGPGASNPLKRSKLSQSIIPSSDSPSTPLRPNKAKKKKQRPAISQPSRRLVPIIVPPPPAGFHSAPPTPAERKMMPDERVLTAVDLMFAIEREGGTHGMGTLDEVVWKIQAKVGGVWGKEGWGPAALERGQGPVGAPVIGRSLGQPQPQLQGQAQGQAQLGQSRI